MTTRTEIFEQAKSIADRFSATLESPLFLNTQMDFDNEIRINFGPIDVTPYNKYCSIIVGVAFTCHEESDDVGFFTSQKVKVNFNTGGNYGSTHYSLEDFGIKLPAFNKAYELMNLLVTELPFAVIHRLETREERTENLAKEKALVFCRRMTKDNSKHLRIESAKLLEAPPSELKMGEYTLYYNGKDYKVILTSSSTLLIRTA